MPTTKLLDDDTFFDRALRAYQRACKTSTEVFQQPEGHFEVADNVIRLGNVHGVIARYEANRVGNAGEVRVVRLRAEVA